MATTIDRAFDVVSLDQMSGTEVDGVRVRLDVRRHFGIGAFGTSAVRSIEGGALIREHDETGFQIGQSGQEELYVVLAGRATFTVDGEQVNAPAGTVVFVRDPAAKRSAVAEEPGTTVLAIGGKPGEAFLPLPLEVAQAFEAYGAGEYEKSIEVYEGLLAEQLPDNAGVLYNIACCQALLGRTDAAIERLEAAVQSDDRARELARTDSDLDSLRGDHRFAKLVG
jgi:mannose-6-phosphate isomerase-like protein (cupin superfamily)